MNCSLGAVALARLRDWLLENDNAKWDLQFESEATAGRLDTKLKQAQFNHADGKNLEI